IRNIICEGDEPGALRSLVAAGLGVAFLPMISQRAGAGPEVAWLHITEPVCQRTVSLVWREDRYLSAAARRFRQFVVEYFASSPQRVGGQRGGSQGLVWHPFCPNAIHCYCD